MQSITGNGDGELTILEMASMLRDLQLRDVSNSDILYFMVGQVLPAFVSHHFCVTTLVLDLVH